MRILNLSKDGKKKIIFTNGDYTIESGDSIIIVTKSKSIRSIEDIFV